MRFRLKGLGAGPHAIYYHAGQRTGDEPLPDGAEVEGASEADKAHMPADLKRLAGDDERGLSLAGVFVVPGRGPAALYGCEAVPIE